MRVLVTGTAGLVGRFTARELVEHGHTVRAIDIRPPGAEWKHDSIERVYADIADPLQMMTLLADCEAVIHCAAYPTPNHSSASELLRVNVIGTNNILDAAVAHGVKRAVITSSVGALGFSFPTHPCLPDYLPVDAAHPRRPQDVYGLSKVMNEESAATATRLSGITTVVMRPPHVMDLEHIKREGWLKRRLEWSSDRRDTSLWGYVDVRDLAVAMRLAVEVELNGYHVFYPHADDVMSRESALALTEKFLPDLVEDAGISPGRSFYDVKTIEDALGWKATRLVAHMLEE